MRNYSHCLPKTSRPPTLSVSSIAHPPEFPRRRRRLNQNKQQPRSPLLYISKTSYPSYSLSRSRARRKPDRPTSYSPCARSRSGDIITSRRNNAALARRKRRLSRLRDSLTRVRPAALTFFHAVSSVGLSDFVE